MAHSVIIGPVATNQPKLSPLHHHAWQLVWGVYVPLEEEKRTTAHIERLVLWKHLIVGSGHTLAFGKWCSTDDVVKPSHCHLSHTSLICSAQGWCHRGANRHHNHVCDVSFRRREPLAVHGNWESISSHSPALIVYTQGHFHFTSSV